MPRNHPHRDEDCIFCKIIAGEIPCARVYEDESILAFLDINPIAKGHTLVVPKAHHPTLLEFDPALGAPLMRALQRVAKVVQAEVMAGGFNVIQNNFTCAGQMVFHAHWHIIPRCENDGLPDWVGGRYADSQEMQQLADDIRARI